MIRPARVWVAASVALAVISWATLPTVPSYDPFSWLVWGREVVQSHQAFYVGGGPSWKPLPFGFTVVYALFGGAAPALWVITARVGGLLGWVAAWRLASRLCPGRWGWVAGAIAVGGLITTQDYGYYFMRGASEPGLVACTLWAIDRLLERRPGAAFWLLVAASLIRPEWWPYTIALAAWLAARGPRFWSAESGASAWASWRGRAALVGGLLLIPLGWFGPPWLGGNDPLLAAHNAALYNGQLGPDPLRAVVGRAVDDQIWPLLAAALVYVAVVVARDLRAGHVSERGWIVGSLGAFVCAWWVEVILMTVWLGYPGLERFFLPAAAVVCVLGGVGMALGARAVGERVVGVRAGRGDATRSPRAPEPARRSAGTAGAAVGGALVVALIVASVLVSRPAVDLLLGAEGQAALAQRTLAGLSAAVAAAGGRPAVLPCPSSFAAVNHSAQPALAWDLRVTLQRVGSAMIRPGVDFIGPADIATGIPAAIDPSLVHDRVVARRGAWTAVALRRRRGGRCVGS
ncbi:MAG TPA: hypothetical protein VKV21_06245 [Solirubrobacteraceae bacterium]|nr:hypothetical protein [Solirubrobacteraceae bacterium]